MSDVPSEFAICAQAARDKTSRSDVDLDLPQLSSKQYPFTCAGTYQLKPQLRKMARLTYLNIYYSVLLLHTSQLSSMLYNTVATLRAWPYLSAEAIVEGNGKADKGTPC